MLRKEETCYQRLMSGMLRPVNDSLCVLTRQIGLVLGRIRMYVRLSLVVTLQQCKMRAPVSSSNSSQGGQSMGPILDMFAFRLTFPFHDVRNLHEGPRAQLIRR